MSIIVGFNSIGFNTAITFLKDGVPVFAVEEERLSREKRTRKFPLQGLKVGLKTLDLKLRDIDLFISSWNPALNLTTFNLAHSEKPRYIPEILYSTPSYILNLDQSIKSPNIKQILTLEDGHEIEINYITHHLAHSALYFASPFNKAAILTADAFGEDQTTTFSIGIDNKINLLKDIKFPHSLGAFYSTFTEYLGFKPQSEEWKLMGLSALGDSCFYYTKIRDLYELKNDGSFNLKLENFNHYQFHKKGFINEGLIDKIGLKPLNNGDTLTLEHRNLAAAVQLCFEEIYLNLINGIYNLTDCSDLVISGGSALNSLANGKIISNTKFKRIFIPPVPDDSGCSLGAALYGYYHNCTSTRTYLMTQNYLGPRYSESEIEDTLRSFKINYNRSNEPWKEAAKSIATGNIIGWFQDGLEFGDRALGNRSILADPRDPKIKDKLNHSVKYRESFRPFAPAILREYCEDYFENPEFSPFMERVCLIKPSVRHLIPGCTHDDGTGRLQTVTENQNFKFYNLILEFRNLTNIPIVINTSFNTQGEPIVCSPSDALRTFYSSGLNQLFIGNFIIRKA